MAWLGWIPDSARGVPGSALMTHASSASPERRRVDPCGWLCPHAGGRPSVRFDWRLTDRPADAATCSHIQWPQIPRVRPSGAQIPGLADWSPSRSVPRAARSEHENKIVYACTWGAGWATVRWEVGGLGLGDLPPGSLLGRAPLPLCLSLWRAVRVGPGLQAALSIGDD